MNLGYDGHISSVIRYISGDTMDTYVRAATWRPALLAEPCNSATVVERFNTLLDGKSLKATVAGKDEEVYVLKEYEKKKGLEIDPECVLEISASNANFYVNPSAIDAFWSGLFELAVIHDLTQKVRAAAYFWSSPVLGEWARDAIPVDERMYDEEEVSDDDDWHDDYYITFSLGAARLFSLGYCYNRRALASLIVGLGIPWNGGNWSEEEGIVSDSIRIGSCAQLLAGGQRIKTFLNEEVTDYDAAYEVGPWLGGKEDWYVPVRSYEWCKAVGKEAVRKLRANPPEWVKPRWKRILWELEHQQTQACPRAAELLQVKFSTSTLYMVLSQFTAHSDASIE